MQARNRFEFGLRPVLILVSKTGLGIWVFLADVQ